MLQRWVVSYDIANQRRRMRAAQYLLDHGERVQESVYEVLLHPGEWKRLTHKLNRLIDPIADQWRAWPLCAADHADVREWGLPSQHPHAGPVIV